ncbi:hypothetical protein N7508_009497 [Penicillium antarcticum]|uniref:uncharacterized protein n=1 Tax=Penicillium antarcticum TaxID=416450 RepID=UPI002398C7FE|nr:uncharacterized protein N7508_009497 [Penicillium antarcticum]KAJ5294676.1 hypothetical protein N7508_009497 [Penicillium antarcticum]
MGNLAELGERQKDMQGMRPWFLEQARRHNSAITQIFLGPFAKPAILLSDFREVNDILSHRDAVDFKRGKKVDVFSGILPHAHPAMETLDPRFRESRDLVRDLMAPSFLHTKGFYMPWPRVYHAINNLRPSVRHAGQTLRGYIESQITRAIPRLNRGGGPECALDYVIGRELKAAQKAGREPMLDDPRVRDEIYGYLIAGHDTSTGSFIWLMRRLLSHPEEQTKIFVTIMVQTRMDTVVLGHAVPRDTQVFLNLTGPSLNMPSVSVEETSRSKTSQTYEPTRHSWDDLDPEVFRPERWLRKDAEGKWVFDAASGPTLAFSAGNRGCWGKRLGQLELRIVFTIPIWSAKFNVHEKHVSWETYDTLVTAPKQCLMSLTEVQ